LKGDDITVVELIEALIPYGDEAHIRVAVTVRDQTLHYERFDVRPDGDGGVAFVAHE
jgi:hypothetical protein